MSIEKKTLSEDLIDLVGADNVIIHDEELEKYGLDMFGEKHTPLLVVKPSSPAQFKRLNFILRRNKIASITPRGKGYDINLGAYSDDLIIDLTLLNKKMEIDTEKFVVTVQTGMNIADLQDQLEKKGFHLPIEPILNGTLGGFIASGGIGYGTFQYGSIMNYLRSATLILSNGQRIQTGTPGAPLFSRGYNLNSIVCGSEGFFGIIEEAVIEILPKTPHSLNLLLKTDINSLLSVIPKLANLSTIYNLSLFKTLNMHNPSGLDLFIRLEGAQTVVEEDFTKIKVLSEEKGSNLNEANNLWDNRPKNPSQIPPASTIIELIVPTKHIPEFIKFCEAFENPSYFGIFLDATSVLLYIFLGKEITPDRKSDILTELKTSANQFELYPPTIENNIKGFVKESYPNLALLKKLKPIFDKANRLKSRKFDF